MPEDPRIVDEMRKMPYEPLLPAEKKLIAGSLLLGLLLLGVFVGLTHAGH